MNRPLVGILSLVMLLAWAALYVWGRDSGAFEQYGVALGRPGILLAVLWLAAPDLKSPRSRLVLGVFIVAAGVLILLPRAWPFVLAAFVLLAVLRPRGQRLSSR